MKRDMDFVRDILLKIEAFEPTQECSINDLLQPESTHEDLEKLSEHLKMLINEARYLDGKLMFEAGSMVNCANVRLTWKGHEYLDNIRDPEIWQKTKEGAAKVGGFSVDIIGALAKGLIKKQIEKHTGVELEF